MPKNKKILDELEDWEPTDNSSDDDDEPSQTDGVSKKRKGNPSEKINPPSKRQNANLSLKNVTSTKSEN